MSEIFEREEKKHKPGFQRFEKSQSVYIGACEGSGKNSRILNGTMWL